jgi:hypothetical protein
MIAATSAEMGYRHGWLDAVSIPIAFLFGWVLKSLWGRYNS